MHTNTITIFLIEITTNECFKSHNNRLYHSLKYGEIAKFGNYGSKVYFIAENPHLIESNDRESSVILTGSILNSILGVHWPLFVTSLRTLEKREVQKIVRPVYRELVVYRESVVKRFSINQSIKLLI
jgi:hypothetical protein